MIVLLAEGHGGERISPSPNDRAICPFCRSEVIAKCGEIVTWHWAHKSLETCDSWGEPEGEWHYEWKKLAGLDNTEITIERDGKRHRADIVINDTVIELQHSPLPVCEVRERENFYNKMFWIVDGGSIIRLLGDCYIKKSPTLLESSPAPVERWVSKNGKFYLKWVGRMREWVDEISKDKWVHFSEIPLKTYYWHIERYDRPQFNRYTGEWVKQRYHKQLDERFEETILKDVMVRPKGKFCNILTKREFVGRHLLIKPASLFDF